MPCILKSRTPTSPGVITFTHNETLRGVCTLPRVRRFLNESSKKGQWLYGVHVQGQFSWTKNWPLQPWESFHMWPVPRELLDLGIPQEKILPLNCINFMPPIGKVGTPDEKIYDLCVITRASPIKRTREILHIIRGLYDLRPDMKVALIMPDERKIALGNRCYKAQGLDREVYELPGKLFRASELKNLTFICSSDVSFGRFPLGAELVHDILRKSKFLLAYSYSEGTTRAWAEAFQVGTPIMVNENMNFCMFDQLDAKYTVYLKDDIAAAIPQIDQVLSNWKNYVVDTDRINKAYCEIYHKDELRKLIGAFITKDGHKVDGTWYLDDLHLRLPCHGERFSYQFMNREKLFFDWIKRIEQVKNPTDEDDVFGQIDFNDKPVFSPRKWAEQEGRRVLGAAKRRAKSYLKPASPG